MPSPISQFGYTLNGLEVQFTSLSLNVTAGTTYSWDFGDGNVSTEQNPLHTFATEAFFIVTLSVTNPDDTFSDSSNTLNLSGSPAPTLFTNIPNIIDLYAPSSIIGLIQYNQQKEFFISKWQNYLQPQMDSPAIEVSNTYIEQSWPPLANSLIARLVVIDIITAEASKFALNSVDAGANNTLDSTNSSTTASNPNPGPIKSIETGPTKIERYENKDVSSTSEKQINLAKAFAEIIKQGGLLDTQKELACQEAESLKIYLPMCGAPKNLVRQFIVAKKY